jgi:5-carboxymethyl-2-hydroxymuconate isomerase
MPHFTIEFSPNIEAHVDMQSVCEAVRLAALATGVFPVGGTRVRAFRADFCALTNGDKSHGFVDVVLRMGEGRSVDVRKQAGESVFIALKEALKGVFAAMPVALSFQINEIPATLSWKENNIHALLEKK